MNRTKYTKESLKNMGNAGIERTDLGFRAFKSLRGTAPYFEHKKRELYAAIRQLGSPHIFFTKSAYESKMIELLQSLLEKDKNKLMTKEDASALSVKEIND